MALKLSLKILQLRPCRLLLYVGPSLYPFIVRIRRVRQLGLLMIEVTGMLQIIYFLGLMSPVIFMIGWSKGYKDGHKEGRFNGRYQLEKTLRK
jgi:hypothetical protein